MKDSILKKKIKALNSDIRRSVLYKFRDGELFDVDKAAEKEGVSSDAMRYHLVMLSNTGFIERVKGRRGEKLVFKVNNYDDVKIFLNQFFEKKWSLKEGVI